MTLSPTCPCYFHAVLILLGLLHNHPFFKKDAFTASFSLFSSFQYTWQFIGNVKFADDGIQTAEPLELEATNIYQLSHNHFP